MQAATWFPPAEAASSPARDPPMCYTENPDLPADRVGTMDEILGEEGA
jgi:hypothetical protein